MGEPVSTSAGLQWKGSTPAGFQEDFRANTYNALQWVLGGEEGSWGTPAKIDLLAELTIGF